MAVSPGAVAAPVRMPKAYFGVHPFIEANPKAVFIRRTRVAHKFDNEGKLVASTGTTLTIDRADTGATTPMSMQLDLSALTSLTSRSSDLVMTEQDGSPIGTLNAFSIGANGVISGSFSNGLTRTLGQIAMATFNNANGLVDKGSALFTSGSNSGVATISGWLRSRESTGGGSGSKTSSPAPASLPLSSASSKASESTNGPRAMLST